MIIHIYSRGGTLGQGSAIGREITGLLKICFDLHVENTLRISCTPRVPNFKKIGSEQKTLFLLLKCKIVLLLKQNFTINIMSYLINRLEWIKLCFKYKNKYIYQPIFKFVLDNKIFFSNFSDRHRT